MDKTKLIAEVCSKTGKKKEEVANIIDNAFGCIGDCMNKGETVQLKGFGTFSVKTRAARKARNLHTGEIIDVPESDYVHFKPSKNIKQYSFNI